MADIALKVEDLVKTFGGVVATDNLNFDIVEGETHAVIGPNGAGKTTLVAQISGMLKPDSGRVLFHGEDITQSSSHARSHLGLARSFQITSVFRKFTALENVALSIQAHQGHSFRFWKPAAADTTLTEPAMKLLDRIGLSARANVISANLSHGEQRQLEIAMALATDPKLLLLDEPTAGMGAEESENIRQFLSDLKGQYSILLIEHDMDTVFSLADRLTVLVYGRAIATGSPAEIRANEDVRAAYLGEDDVTANA